MVSILELVISFNTMVRKLLLLIILLIWSVSYCEALQIFQTPKAFVNNTFEDNPPKAKVLWLTKNLRPMVKEILHHNYIKRRIQYWSKGSKSTWILQETGKEKLITIGIVVDEDKISEIKVLEFREKRGDEIRHAFFTDQFVGAFLKSSTQLDRHIDGISGATLSVNAMKKLARLALYLDRIINEK